MLTVGSLFSGIGGFDLGLERAGMRVIWQSEIDPYACAILHKHWPHVPNHGDIRTIDATSARRPDVICGGFPCQPFSSAARGLRHGADHDAYLWSEMCRVIEQLEPTWVIGENVTHIDGMALGIVEADLVRLGYAIQIFEIPACAVGFDHRRQRIWILGHTDRERQSRLRVDAEVAGMPQPDDDTRGVGAAHGISGRLDSHRMRTLGNAIVPQVAEVIGRAIVESERIQVAA